MQLALTFSVPSSNHLMCRLSGFHETSFTLVKGLIQSRRLACSAQNPSGSLIDCAYIASYFALSMKVRSFALRETGIRVSVMADSAVCWAGYWRGRVTGTRRRSGAPPPAAPADDKGAEQDHDGSGCQDDQR